MKKGLIYLACLAAMAGCAKQTLVHEDIVANGDGTIGFVMQQKNMLKSYSDLQDAGHYNFGVFAYKSTDKVNNIMADYLVGFHDDAHGYSTSGTTVGDVVPGREDGVSQWMYEGLGWGEFTGTYAGQRLNKGDAFASNVENQYLRYWDKAAASTCFYAYAPYTNTLKTGKTVTYVDGQEVGTSTDKYVMTIPNGTIKHATVEAGEDYSLYEYMYASKKVAKADYGHDVSLNFKRLNAKVNIKFWEDIPGYNVRIIDVDPTYSVSAVPSIKDGTSNNYGYKLGKIYSENGAKIQFAEGASTGMKQYEGTTVSTPINFTAPKAAKIGESRLNATPSTTTYFAIPKGSSAAVLSNTADKMTDAGVLNTDLAETGLTFHVSYELISTTGEVITVKDATVHVSKEYVNWNANTHYTYIFKITKNSNGTTDSDDTPNPTDPEVPTEQGLYPIVFDNCTVEDWTENETEWEITEGTGLAYHDVQLSAYSVASGSPATITVTVTDNDTFAGHAINYANVAVTGPAGADMSKVVYTSGDHTIAVAPDAAAGVYTVTYTCNPTGLQYNNHPATWTETFLVENAYTITTNLPAVGTNALAATALRIEAEMDGSAVTPAAAQLAIEYPVNLTPEEKALVKVSSDGTKVEVAKTATPGQYKLVYTITVEGSKIKVAEKVFDVVDYQPALTHSVVYLEGSPVVVKLGRTGGDEAMWVDNDFSGKITCGNDGGSNMTITVANDTPEGVRTVYYVVNQSDADSKSMYQCTFNVQNTYSVALSKTTLQRDLGRANEAAQGTDEITISIKKNGVATATDLTSALKIKLGDTDVTSNFTIAYTSANLYTLKVNKEADVNVVYTVEYTGQAGKVATVDFTVQK